jgi:hypothetical protein
MNTTRTAAAAACLAALLAGATACGTDDGTSTTAVDVSPGVKAGRTSAELGAAKAAHDARQRELAEKQADAVRWGHGHLAHRTRR